MSACVHTSKCGEVAAWYIWCSIARTKAIDAWHAKNNDNASIQDSDHLCFPCASLLIADVAKTQIYVYMSVYWGSKNYNRCLEVTIPSQEPSRLLPLKIQNKQMKIPHPGSQEKIQQYGDMYVYSCECLCFSACTNWTFGFLSRYVRMPRKKCDRSELDNAAERMLGILSILAYWSICHP